MEATIKKLYYLDSDFEMREEAIRRRDYYNYVHSLEKEIVESKSVIAEKDSEIAEKDSLLEKNAAEIVEKDSMLEKNAAEIIEKDSVIAELKRQLEQRKQSK